MGNNILKLASDSLFIEKMRSPFSVAGSYLLPTAHTVAVERFYIDDSIIPIIRDPLECSRIPLPFGEKVKCESTLQCFYLCAKKHSLHTDRKNKLSDNALNILMWMQQHLEKAGMELVKASLREN